MQIGMFEYFLTLVTSFSRSLILVCESFIRNKFTLFFIPIFPIERVLDPTGAGDSFAGGFMGYLSQTQNPDFIEAVIMGSAMASFCVEGFGMEALLEATTSSLYHRIKIIKSLMSEGV